VQLCKWEKSLEDQPGVTGAVVNTFEMIITFSKELMKGNGLEIPPQMTWMDGLMKMHTSTKEDATHYGLKILFVLMCSPQAMDKKLKSLDEFLNGLNFSLNKIALMSIQDISDEIWQIGMQNKNAYFSQQASFSKNQTLVWRLHSLQCWCVQETF